jgi:aminoglycoside phosphotransferase (APT) family kinase protein
MHKDELHIDEELARRLIHEQFPQWRGLDVRMVPTSATVNAIFHIGDSLAARFPLRGGDPDEVHRRLSQESAAAREFATVSPVPSPLPVALGRPGHGYPVPWSVQTWVAGHDGVAENPTGSEQFAEDLAALIRRLRAVPTRGRRFSGKGRGGHLPDHDDWVALCFDRSEGLLDVHPLRALWAQLRVLPDADELVMSHGDLTPPNVLVDAGRLTGVLDTGGFGPADPALDLVAAWHLLDDRQRVLFRRLLPCGDVEWRRGVAWALQQAIGLVWYYAETNPVMSSWGRRTLDRIVGSGAYAP